MPSNFSSLRRPIFPSSVVYNLNHISLSDMKRRNEKISFLRSLCENFPIIGLQEIHARTRTEALLYFFDHLDMHVYFHESSDGSINQASLVSKVWFAKHRASLKHSSIVPGALHGIQWITETGQPCFFLNMYLDSTADVSIKLSQLRDGSAWARNHLTPGSVVFGGGDRNHIRYPHERMHSAAGHRCGRPHHQLNQTFDEFCAAFNHCSILEQPDFTMVRKDNDDVLCSVLDILFTNVDQLTEPLYVPVSYRVPTPDSEARDHSPVALKWLVASRRRGGATRRSDKAQEPVRSALPVWLLDDPSFSALLETKFASWLSQRSPGGRAFSEFADLVYEEGRVFSRAT